MKRIALVFAALALSGTLACAEKSQYYVYCANGKIEVDSRDMKQMKSARGSDVFQLGAFDYLSDAQDFAKRFGGVGADCSKK